MVAPTDMIIARPMGIMNKMLPEPETNRKPTMVMTGIKMLIRPVWPTLAASGGLGIGTSPTGSSGWMRGGRSTYSTAIGVPHVSRQHRPDESISQVRFDNIESPHLQ